MSIQREIWMEDLNVWIREQKKQCPDRPFPKEMEEKGEVQPVWSYEVCVGKIKASFCEIGAAILSIRVSDKEGKERDVVLGVRDPESSLHNWPAFGAVIGRCTNRIKGAVFSLNGNTYRLAENIAGGCLHSGFSYHYRKWDSRAYEDEQGAHIIFSLVSEDGDQGFPGKLQAEVEYLLSKDRSLTVEYRYRSDKDTIVNLTNHSYFNLSGQASGSVLDHRVMIASSYVAAVDKELMPTGELIPVEGTAFDFRKPERIRDNMTKPFTPVCEEDAYDINYVVHEKAGQFSQVAELFSEESGIGMKVWSDMPGMQFYTGNAIERVHGKENVRYAKYPGVCFETQYFPDAINIPAFESPVVKAGEEKHSITRFEFFTVTD